MRILVYTTMYSYICVLILEAHAETSCTLVRVLQQQAASGGGGGGGGGAGCADDGRGATEGNAAGHMWEALRLMEHALETLDESVEPQVVINE
jgi:hypothetical protein